MQSDLFKFVIENKSRFYEVIGKEKVDRTIALLIDQRLFQGFPRPKRDEVIQLFKYRSPANAEKLTDDYFLARSIEEKIE